MSVLCIKATGGSSKHPRLGDLYFSSLLLSRPVPFFFHPNQQRQELWSSVGCLLVPGVFLLPLISPSRLYTGFHISFFSLSSHCILH